jgi:hypothetical protein
MRDLVPYLPILVIVAVLAAYGIVIRPRGGGGGFGGGDGGG